MFQLIVYMMCYVMIFFLYKTYGILHCNSAVDTYVTNLTGTSRVFCAEVLQEFYCCFYYQCFIFFPLNSVKIRITIDIEVSPNWPMSIEIPPHSYIVDLCSYLQSDVLHLCCLRVTQLLRMAIFLRDCFIPASEGWASNG